MKEKSAGKKRISGQTVIELLIALAIAVIAIASITIVSLSNQAFYLDTETNSKALEIAQNELEEIIAASKNNFDSIAPSSSTVGIFTKEISIDPISPYQKQITSRVSWDISPTKDEKIELIQIVTNPFGIDDVGGDTGGTGTTGDWRNPRTLGSISLNPSGNQGTGLDVLNYIVYMTSSHASPASADFWIIDATDGTNPVIKSSLDVGSPLNAIDVAGNYAYVASESTSTQLQVIDITNINSPFLASSFSAGGSGKGVSIFYLAEKVYIGTSTNSGNEFFVINVSNPLLPSILGSYEVGGDVNAIYVRDNKAYISTSVDNAEVMILDISDPANITSLGSFNSPGNNDGLSNYLDGANLYLGKSKSSGEFSILNIFSPSAITSISSTNITSNVNGIYVRDNLAFIGGDHSNREFQVWNISNPASPELWSYFNFPQIVTDIDYENNFVYVSVRSNDALRIITSNP